MSSGWTAWIVAVQASSGKRKLLKSFLWIKTVEFSAACRKFSWTHQANDAVSCNKICSVETDSVQKLKDVCLSHFAGISRFSDIGFFHLRAIRQLFFLFRALKMQLGNKMVHNCDEGGFQPMLFCSSRFFCKRDTTCWPQNFWVLGWPLWLMSTLNKILILSKTRLRPNEGYWRCKTLTYFNILHGRSQNR